MKLENDVAPQEYGLLLVKENVFFYDENALSGGESVVFPQKYGVL